MSVMVQNPPKTFFSELVLAVNDEQGLTLDQHWVPYEEANLLVFFLKDESDLSLAILPPFVNDIWSTVDSGPPAFLKYLSGTIGGQKRIDFAFFTVSQVPDGADLGCVSSRQLVVQFTDVTDAQLIDTEEYCG